MSLVEDAEGVFGSVLVEEAAHSLVLRGEFRAVGPEVEVEDLSCGVLVEVVLSVGALDGHCCLLQLEVLLPIDEAPHHLPQ